MQSPLADPTFRRLFGAQVVALAGTGLSTVALALLAYDLAGGDAGTVLGTALALKMVAYVGLAPVFGAVAHRLPRRTFLVGLDVLRAVTIACLPFVTEIWQVYVLIFVLNGCSAGFTPIFQATIPDVLPEEERYTRALSLSRLAYDLENLLSPALAAAVLLVLSYDALFAANTVAFVVSALLVLSTRLPPPAQTDRGAGLVANIRFGLGVYLKTPRLRGLFALSFAAAAAGAMVIVNTVVYVRDRFGASESETAVAFAATGFGSMVVALTLPKLLDRHPDRGFMLAGGFLLAGSLGLLLATPGMAPLLATWFLIGAGGSLVQTPAGRLLRRSAREGDRPAVYAAQFALSHACWLFAYPVAGWAGSKLGLEATAAILGLVALGASIAAAIVWPAEDRVEIEHVHDAIEHSHPHIHDEHHQHVHGDEHVHTADDGTERHAHWHRHPPVRHKHAFVIDMHHPIWPTR